MIMRLFINDAQLRQDAAAVQTLNAAVSPQAENSAPARADIRAVAQVFLSLSVGLHVDHVVVTHTAPSPGAG